MTQYWPAYNGRDNVSPVDHRTLRLQQAGGPTSLQGQRSKRKLPAIDTSSPAAMSEPVLPPEVLHLIFTLLPPRHLAAALQVCWLWRQVGEAARLWRNVVLRVNRDNIGLMSEVLAARRMLEVTEITVGDVKHVEMVEDVEKVEDFEKVENIDKVFRGEIRLLTARSFKQVENLKKVKGVEKVEDIENFEKVENVNAIEDIKKVDNAKKVEDVEDVEALLLAISRHRSVTKLNLYSTDLTSVEAGLLAGVLSGVGWLELEAAKISTRQMETFLGAICGQARLKKLSFSKMDLTAVEPVLMAQAVNCLEGVGFAIESAKLADMQVEAIFAHMANNETKLRTFGCDFSTVPQYDLVRALNKLEMYIGSLDGPMAEALLKQSLVQTKLRRVIITVSKKLDVDINLVLAARKVITHLDVSKTAVYHEPSAECPNNHPR